MSSLLPTFSDALLGVVFLYWVHFGVPHGNFRSLSLKESRLPQSFTTQPVSIDTFLTAAGWSLVFTGTFSYVSSWKSNCSQCTGGRVRGRESLETYLKQTLTIISTHNLDRAIISTHSHRMWLKSIHKQVHPKRFYHQVLVIWPRSLLLKCALVQGQQLCL